MNINTGIVSLNVNNVLTKRQLEKSTLVINDEIKCEIKNNIKSTDENLVASESNIKNIEMAEELLKRTKDSILEQSTIALLSQANKNSSDVITLLN